MRVRNVLWIMFMEKHTAKGALRVRVSELIETALVHFLRNVLRPSPLSHLLISTPLHLSLAEI
jgi:hypothetical protein